MRDPGGPPRDPWKKRMGVEFSGLEATRDFFVALGFLAILIISGMLIAYFAFG